MIAILAAFALVQASAAQSQGRVAPDARAPGEIAAAAPAADWVSIDASNLLVVDLAPDAAGRARRAVIELMPAPFAQGWIANIRTLASARWWDGTSVNRVQDNYVVQWGDATEKKPLPAGIRPAPATQYTIALPPAGIAAREARTPYAAGEGLYRGWPIGFAGDRAWPVHCYGMVGVGRNLAPDTGSGAELYAVIGHAPRHLDRNIALVGRVIAGIEHLSSLPRGTEALGFYKTAAERTPIARIRLASDLPAAERPAFESLSTDSASFRAYAEARANRRDAFFNVPAGGADVCNVPVPVRPAR
ncbi:peptidylprolyl isomerase [Sphingomonas baiyangensis]|uniref:Peptidylprolyl isomerase n=1 Tax=Sphingomonas baiyangensis TaxID=2572576 RepID=A0A4U1L5M9_9SPHN|nr:peptidylprolyl isomerase [Sphingomonas baiyangensis]TKD51516.1 peptidylprolyl isomerase [Sphingomonas baiyangensis]